MLKKIERLDSNFNPHLYYDNEQYFEILVKVKEAIAKHQKRRKKNTFKKTIFRTFKKVLKVLILYNFFLEY